MPVFCEGQYKRKFSGKAGQQKDRWYNLKIMTKL